MKVAGKVIDRHVVVQKGDHFFHSTYLAAEAALGHGLLSWLALGALVFVVADILIHWIEHA